jgi:hypothetical protein
MRIEVNFVYLEDVVAGEHYVLHRLVHRSRLALVET